MNHIGFALTSSYCTLDKVLPELKNLVTLGYDVVPIVSDGIIHNTTRFGDCEHFKTVIEEYTGKNVISTINESEKFGSKDPLDAIIVAPATGNFVSKLANGITDNAVTMAVKATLRNNSPIIIGISTNDGLGFSGMNISKLIYSKNIFFIPFGQDDCQKKPNSLVSHFDLLADTLKFALKGKQIEPILKEFK